MMPKVGVTYALGEENYRYGSGPLLVRVTRVLSETEYDGEPWWEVEAMVKPPGTVGPAHERRLYLKASGLRGTHRSWGSPGQDR